MTWADTRVRPGSGCSGFAGGCSGFALLAFLLLALTAGFGQGFFLRGVIETRLLLHRAYLSSR